MLAEIRRVGVPGAEVHAPNYTLVNLDTSFYTDPEPINRGVTIIGYDVDVEVAPSAYTWHWGDGTTEATDLPGRPYPATDVTHTYSQATKDGGPLTLTVDVNYSARYRVDGGAWLDIPKSITVPGPATALPVKQASAVLVAGD